jgi:hypothetical protein
LIPEILAFMAILAIRSCLILFFLSVPMFAQAPSSQSTEDSCRRFVQQFYNWYLPKAKSSKGRASDLVLKYKSSMLSPELAKELKADSAAQDKAKGDLVGLDFDPFLNTQDDSFEKCVTGKVVAQATSCRIEVSCNFPSQKTELLVTPELTLTNNQWIFVNFHYHTDSGDDDLLHILKGLREERKPKSK